MIVKKVASLGHLTFALACVLSIIVSLIDVFPLSCLACFFWGFNLFYITSSGMVICSKMFEGKYEAFAVVKQVDSFALILYYCITLVSENSIPIPYIMIALLLLAIPSLWLTRQLPEESTDKASLIET